MGVVRDMASSPLWIVYLRADTNNVFGSKKGGLMISAFTLSLRIVVPAQPRSATDRSFSSRRRKISEHVTDFLN